MNAQLFIAHSYEISTVYIVAAGGSLRGISTAGDGVVGPFGPRTGTSSGISPGNSCGCGGEPGSCTGGGISGFGLPGGIPGGGSVGVPGVAGGISGGSIPIYIATFLLSPISGRVPVAAAVAIFT